MDRPMAPEMLNRPDSEEWHRQGKPVSERDPHWRLAKYVDLAIQPLDWQLLCSKRGEWLSITDLVDMSKCTSKAGAVNVKR